jgi:hypothetical protein
MIAQTVTMRLLAVVLWLACAVFASIGGYRLLQSQTGPITAPMMMAGLTAALAIALLVIVRIRTSQRRARLNLMMSALIDHKPVAGLAAAVVAGAAARFGLEPEDLFPVFEAFASPQDKREAKAKAEAAAASR